MKRDSKVLIYLASFVLGLDVGMMYHRMSSKTIPDQQQIQQGFISPSKVEIICEDLDHNGKLETYMKIGEDKYMLRDVKGKPTLSPYELKPAEVVPRE